MSDMSATSTGNQPSSFFTPPSLPKGGGTLSGNGGSLSVGGAEGAAGWQIPLPVSAAPNRSLAPQMALSYSSGGGNGCFGMGWQLGLPVIRQRTQNGVPHYDATDRFIGPNGDDLLRATDAERTETTLPFATAKSGTYSVTRYLSRFGGLSSRTERWEEKNADNSLKNVFWIDFSPDGSLSLFGWSAGARLASPENAGQIAEWRIEETVTARGEHIVWRWRQEDAEGCGDEEISAHPHVANLYPDSVHWMNKAPALHFLLPESDVTRDQWQQEWLAFLLFDYGERETPTESMPPVSATRPWPAREDALSSRRYGFEVRTRRLCHDILLWHRTAMMADEGATDATPVLISRLHLEYATSPVITQLVSAQTLAYEANGSPLAMPPVEFALSEPPQTLPAAKDWHHHPALDGFSHEYWQMADLYGEGIPGLLYQDSGAWWYRAPERSSEGTDKVTWGEAKPLARAPWSGSGQLADVDGDGKPEWMMTLAGMRGTFTLQPDGGWGGFKPFQAFPAELMHPAALQADLTGGGLADVVMIGPHSVRLWSSAGSDGWNAAQDVPRIHEDALPRPPGDGSRLVALSDMTGGGLADLVEITAEAVTVWPSLGHGRFDAPLRLSGFSLTEVNRAEESDLHFAPERIYLADTDGSGMNDILWVGKKGIHVFISQSGNSFRYKGVIPPPPGITPDNTWRLQVSDVQGLGMGSLILTVPHMRPRSWLLNFSEQRPWLLQEVVDNIGGRIQLEYRSSAQGWLDEKAELQQAGKPAVSYLPFPVHTVSRVTQINELTGLRLGSETRYLGGVWDGEERELAGFTRLIQRDIHARAQGTAAEITPPSEVRSWFFTGLREHDEQLNNTFEGVAELPARPVRFTQWQIETGEAIYTPDEKTASWLRRALRGRPARTELYGLDDSDKSTVPYSISCQRWQIRAVETQQADMPCAIATALEEISYSCERIEKDPVISQSIILSQDIYGTPTESVSINYPRLLSPAQVDAEEEAREIYPASLPPGLIKAACDTQQYDCWINLSRTESHSLTSGNDFVLGLPASVRSDVIWWGTTHPEGNPEGRTNRAIPDGGFSAETLSIEDLLADPDAMTLTGFVNTRWRGSDGVTGQDLPTRQALVGWTETAMLDEKSLDVLRPTFNQTLRDLADEIVNDKTGTKDPIVLKHLRQRVEQQITPSCFFDAFMAFASQQETILSGGYNDEAGTRRDEAVKALRAALKDKQSGVEIVPVSTLWTALGETPNGGIPRHRLVQAVATYTRQQREDDGGLTLLMQRLTEGAPDLLYWQVLFAAMGTEKDAQLQGLISFLQQPVQAASLEELLKQGGYRAITIPHQPPVNEVWGGWHNLTLYKDQSAFWSADKVRESELVAETQLSYSAHHLTVVKATDDISFVSEVTAVDWRFMAPVQIKDTNDNISEAAMDALGRVMHHRFYGTETPAGASEAVMTGYSPSAEKGFTPPKTAEAAVALNLTKQVPVHEAFTTITDSWMPEAMSAEGHPTGRRCGELAWRRQAALLKHDGLTPPDIMTGRTPPHVIRIQTDRYDSDPEQQVRVQVALHGGGQVLQTAILNPAGESFVRTASGALETDAAGKAVSIHADIRWAVSGRTEFDNKGNAIRGWLPFYLNDWRWVSDDSARDGIYADTHLYDALNREYRVLTAAGYERRSQAYPWFTVAEDENDTWEEVLARQKAERQQGEDA